MRTSLSVLACFALLSFALGDQAVARQVEAVPVVYTVIDLGSLQHPDQDACFGLQPGANVRDVGVGNRAVGSIYQEGDRAVATLFSGSGPRKMVSGEGGGIANAINGNGVIAGAIFAELPAEPCGSPSAPSPVFWNDEFEMSALPLPDGVVEGSAVAINQDGAIAGWIETDRGRRASLWSNDNLFVIQHPEFADATDIESEATSINDEGMVAGTVRWNADGQAHARAFVWDGRNASYLDPHLGEHAFATAINNAGVVAGAVTTDDGTTVADMWWRGQLVTLNPLPDRPNAVVTDVNNAGFAVGYGAREDGLTRAMIWISGSAFDLNDIVSQDAGWQLQMAVGINDDGVIAGWADLDGERRAVLLVPAAG